MFKFMNWLEKIKRDTAKGDGGDGGGGTGNGTGNNQSELDAIKAQNAELLKRLDALEKSKPAPNNNNDEDLSDKARKEREAKEALATKEKKIEQAVSFVVSAPQWLKDNASLLPKTIESIFAQAEKENFDSALEKAQALKVGVISEYFALQANLDLLTDAQKILVDDFKKLTKTDKQARVDELYSNVFEPAFSYAIKLEKAQQLKEGTAPQSDVQKAYADKLINLSRKTYLRGEQK